MPPTASSIQTMLGLGYAGSINVDGYWLMLRGSSATEDDNIIRSAGNFSNQIPFSVGEIPVRNRRALTLGISTDLTLNSLAVALVNTLSWRNAALNGKASTVYVYLANGEGYYSPEAYVDSATISVQEGQMGQASFQIKSWLWQDLYGNPTPRAQAAFIPFAASAHQPIPHWATTVNHPSQPGVPLAWNLALHNQYQFYQLLEITPYPPTPRVVTPGLLTGDLSLTTLADPGARPQEGAINVSIQIGGGPISGTVVPLTTIVIPEVVRDPNRQGLGWGEQNSPIRWQASWKIIRQCPTFG